MARASRSSNGNLKSATTTDQRTASGEHLLPDDAAPLDEQGDEEYPTSKHRASAPAIGLNGYFVNARDGLNIRSGPGLEFPVMRSLPLGTRVNLLKREGRWGLIDEQGDGAADGFVHLGFLNEQSANNLSPADSTGADVVRTFWAQRNPRQAKLYDRTGNALVDPRLLQASASGTVEFEIQNPKLRIEMYGPSSGFRTSGSITNHGAQPETGRGAAMDFVIIDLKTMQMLTNHPAAQHLHQGTVGENAPIYQSFYNEVVKSGSHLFQDFEQMARFGGYFATGDHAMDTMHIDLRGKRAPMGGGSLKRGFTDQQMRNWNIPKNNPYH